MHFTDENEWADFATQLALDAQRVEQLNAMISNGHISAERVREAMRLTLATEDESSRPVTEAELLEAQQTLLNWNERLAS